MHASNYVGTGLALALALCTACSGDDTAGSAATSASGGSGGGTTTTGAGATTSASNGGAGGAGAAGGSGGAGVGGSGGQGTGGAPITGCAMDGGAKCPEGLMCCSGVPYPPEGICSKDCNLDSDRAIKESFECVDRDRMLARLADLDVSEWSYIRDGAAVRHVGPMAQDFREAFGLGTDAEHIHTVDVQGVTIAAVQALYTRLQELEQENSALKRDHGALERRLEAMERGR